MCGKAYLSYPALYTHIKTKHNSSGGVSGRGRGRPKKDNGEISSLKPMYYPSSFDYFKHPEKMGESKNIKSCVENVFNELFLTKKSKIKNYKSINEHPLLLKLMTTLNSYSNVNPIDPDNSKCDEVFLDYLLKVSKVCQENYFERVLKFVLLFRECLNKVNKINVGGNEYSEVSNSEDAPEISNEFVTEFMDDENEFNISKEEVIDLTQNLCQYMYDNNFTCSKLSLINI